MTSRSMNITCCEAGFTRIGKELTAAGMPKIKQAIVLEEKVPAPYRTASVSVSSDRAALTRRELTAKDARKR